MGMMHDLLGTLPSTFHKENRRIFLTASVPSPTTWSVNHEDILTIQVGQTQASIDLTLLTAAQLRTQLSSAGCSDVTVNNPSESAATIEPDQSGASQDRVVLYSQESSTWQLLRPVGRELSRASKSRESHLNQVILPQSEQYWVDYWGSYFGIRRRTGETDASYIQRIIDEVFRARNTKSAIEQGVKDSLGWTVRITEPWRRIFTLGKSVLSGRDYLQGRYYRYHTIAADSSEGVDWSLVEEEIEALRPAGTLLHPPYNIATPLELLANLLYTVVSHHSRPEKEELNTAILQNIGQVIYVIFRQRGGQVFYQEGGDSNWDWTTWQENFDATWRDRASTTPPAKGKKTTQIWDISALEDFSAMAEIAGDGFWRAIGYYPEQVIDGYGSLDDLGELHATALSFGDFS